MIALLFFIIFIGLSAVFSGTEMAYISRDRISHMARMRGRAGFFYGTMPREVMATILLGNNLVMVGATVAATHLFLDFTGRAQSATLATILSTLSILILGEVIPKAIARSRPEIIMALFGPLIWWVWRILKPVVTGLLRVVKVKMEISPKAELRQLLDRMLLEGKITEKEARIAVRGLFLSDMTLSEACDRNFRLFSDENEARAAMFAQPSFAPVVSAGQDFLLLDAKAVFAGRRDALKRLEKMTESARVTTAIPYLKRGEPVAVVNAEGKLVGLITPQSLMARMVS